MKWRASIERCVWSLFVVPRNPVSECCMSLVCVCVGGGIGPLPQERLDKALRLAIGPEDERNERLEQLGTINADCIARIVVSPRKYKEFLEAMRKNWEKYLERTVGTESVSAGDPE